MPSFLNPELQKSVVDYGADAISTDAFISLWRKQGGALCERLPPTYQRALDDMIMRIESSRLFSGDSCSFSRESLLEAFGTWLEKAEARLASQ
jgi:hypothetical protein